MNPQRQDQVNKIIKYHDVIMSGYKLSLQASKHTLRSIIQRYFHIPERMLINDILLCQYIPRDVWSKYDATTSQMIIKASYHRKINDFN